MKTKFYLMILASLASTQAAHAMGAVDGGGISKLFLSCSNKQHPSVSYRVQVSTGFFVVNGRKTWTTGADVYSVNHFNNQETLIKAEAVRANDSFTDIEGDSLTLKQSGPGNFNMKSFPATLRMAEDNGNEITAELLCRLP